MPDRFLKPAAVAPGARIAVVSLASSARADRITRGMDCLRALGYDVVASEHAFGKHPPYFSGSVEDRLADLHNAFADPSVSAIICTRGGYGSNYLLDGLDLDLIRSHPKPLFAYSDMTAMQTWILDQTRLVSFHGPMVAADFALDKGGIHIESFRAAIGGGLVRVGAAEGLRVLRSGTARGILYGGCLSLLTAALGTHYAPQTEGKLLFFEDVGAKPYQIDRMLRQMILAGKLKGARGFVFGEMLECGSRGADPDLLQQVILRLLEPFNVPIAIGLRSGHVSGGNVTLPFGTEAELLLEGDQPLLHVLDRAVTVPRNGR
ncbi:MAG TPA: LD-carboxypeptidase [Acidobacteriaceae bacterium]|nr:LD-carboxypeptidase [Acidobacteriaceae bacterium]